MDIDPNVSENTDWVLVEPLDKFLHERKTQDEGAFRWRSFNLHAETFRRLNGSWKFCSAAVKYDDGDTLRINPVIRQMHRIRRRRFQRRLRRRMDGDSRFEQITGDAGSGTSSTSMRVWAVTLA